MTMARTTGLIARIGPKMSKVIIGGSRNESDRQKSMQTQIHESFAALGEPSRLAVVHLLRDKPRRPADIAAALSMSRPAISRHLRVLRKSGLVEEKTLEDDARGRVYQLRREAFSELHDWLDSVEAFWVEQLQAFKSHAEQRDQKKLSRRRRK